MTNLNQADNKRTFPTGAQRDKKSGKGRYDLVSHWAMRRLAIRLEEGADHYGERNWESGMPLSEYIDSAQRHIYQLLGGDKSEDHAAAAMWNMMAFMHTEEAISTGVLPLGLDDLPRYNKEVVEEGMTIEWVIEREKKRLCTILEGEISSSIRNRDNLMPGINSAWKWVSDNSDFGVSPEMNLEWEKSYANIHGISSDPRHYILVMVSSYIQEKLKSVISFASQNRKLDTDKLETALLLRMRYGD